MSNMANQRPTKPLHAARRSFLIRVSSRASLALLFRSSWHIWHLGVDTASQRATLARKKQVKLGSLQVSR
eukprot:4306975-Amphidinium_carterae.1